MSQFAVKLASNFSVNQAANFSVIQYADDEETGCCCEGTCFEHVAGLVLQAGTAKAGAPEVAHSRPRCHRLFVWERRTVTGNVMGGASAADYVLKTNTIGFSVFSTPPNHDPFDTTAGSGIPLDDEPYWWATCGIGGWELTGAPFLAPTLAEMEAVRTGTLDDGTYTKLVIVRYQHLNADPRTDPDVIALTDGRVRALKHYSLKH